MLHHMILHDAAIAVKHWCTLSCLSLEPSGRHAYIPNGFVYPSAHSKLQQKICVWPGTSGAQQGHAHSTHALPHNHRYTIIMAAAVQNPTHSSEAGCVFVQSRVLIP